jgi:heptosyltransferase-2
MATDTRYGFRFDATARGTGHHEHGREALNICWDLEFKHRQGRSWSEVLFRMIDHPYRGEGYRMGERVFRPPVHDVGLNHLVGAKFPLKRWSEAHWRDLRAALLPTQTVSWQQGANDLERYIEWIASCRVLVTNDSLGLHIALALGKPTVALFGPTLASEIGDAPGLIKLTPTASCGRCAGEACTRGQACIDQISVGTVRGAVLDLLASSHSERCRGVA